MYTMGMPHMMQPVLRTWVRLQQAGVAEHKALHAVGGREAARIMQRLYHPRHLHSAPTASFGTVAACLEARHRRSCCKLMPRLRQPVENMCTVGYALSNEVQYDTSLLNQQTDRP